MLGSTRSGETNGKIDVEKFRNKIILLKKKCNFLFQNELTFHFQQSLDGHIVRLEWNSTLKICCLNFVENK